MKHYRALSLFFIIAAAAMVSFAQTTPFPAAKVAVIDTESLSDPKTGITKLVNAMGKVAQTYKAKDDELVGMQKQLDSIAAEVGAGKLDAKTAADKQSQYDSIQRNLSFNQDKYKREFDKDMEKETGPLFTEINSALQAFAKARGIDLVIDMAKVPAAVLVLNNALDISDVFIKDFNAKNAAVPVK
jgi:Skp family chaperone for outer membrane proteins